MQESNLQSDHRDFLSTTGGKLKREKYFNNVIGEYFFDVPLENVSILTTILITSHVLI